MKRRNFLKLAAAMPATGLPALAAPENVTLVRDAKGAAALPAVTHAIARLKAALAAQGSKLVEAKKPRA